MPDSSIIIINNLINQAEQIGRNLVLGTLREEGYSRALKTLANRNEQLLSVRSEHVGRENYALMTGEPINNLILSTKEGEIIEFYNCKINVTKQHTLVKTPLQGVDGTVKEFIQASDYTVTVSGDLIMANPKAFPLEPLNLLNKILSKAESLQVASVYLESGFGITELVFERANFNQSNLKHFNVMPFSIDFISDNKHNLED